MGIYCGFMRDYEDLDSSCSWWPFRTGQHIIQKPRFGLLWTWTIFSASQVILQLWNRFKIIPIYKTPVKSRWGMCKSELRVDTKKLLAIIIQIWTLVSPPVSQGPGSKWMCYSTSSLKWDDAEPQTKGHFEEERQ